MTNDIHTGPDFPMTYEGLLQLYTTAVLTNRRLVSMVGNLDFALQSVMAAYQAEDALELHQLLDQYIASQATAKAIQAAQAKVGINVAFPTVQ